MATLADEQGVGEDVLLTPKQKVVGDVESLALE